jgi:thiol-disulfide isomerase/thioredoxin
MKLNIPRHLTLPNLLLGAALTFGGTAMYLRGRAVTRGDRLQPFSIVIPSGGTMRLDDLTGRVLLINVWASWCGPCREELPRLDALAAGFDTSRVAFLALSDDVDGWAAREMLMAFGGLPHMRVGLGLGELQSRYRYPGLPFTMLVDSARHIVRTWPGYGGPGQLATIDSLIRRLAPLSALDSLPTAPPPSGVGYRPAPSAR